MVARRRPAASGGREQALVLLLLEAQPVLGLDVLGAPRLGVQPRLDGLAQIGAAATRRAKATSESEISNRPRSSLSVRSRCSSAAPYSR